MMSRHDDKEEHNKPTGTTRLAYLALAGEEGGMEQGREARKGQQLHARSSVKSWKKACS